jgi:X-Pro dipeptidyl-peptidase
VRRLTLVAGPLALSVLIAPVLIGPSQAAPGEVETTQGKSEPIYTEHVQTEHRIETAHGDIFGFVSRPVVPDGVKVPTILTYSPYNSLGCPTNDDCDVTDSYFTPRGYARAVFDVVGTRESSGCYDYGGIAERETGKAVVDWLGTQDWSNGKVGMIGGSYDGTTQWAAAVEAPEHLTTIVPQVAIDRWYDYAYGQGIRYTLNSESTTDEGFDTPLAFDFGFGFLPPADVDDPLAFAEALSGRINPCERIQHTQYGYDPDPVYDEFWDERDYRARAGNIKASVLIEGQWQDHNVKHWDSTRMYDALPDDLPKRLIMGQQDHSANVFEDARDIRHAWFDYWLLGLDTGVMDLPPVDTLPKNGDRVQEQAWPPVGTRDVPLPLVAGEPTTGQLGLTSPDQTWDDINPAFSEDDMLAGRGAEAYATFATGPLAAAVRISGSPQLELSATTDAVSTHLTPVLFDVDPEAGSTVITRGFLNTRNRNGLDKSETLTAGEPYTATVELWDTDYIVASRHEIQLVLMSSNSIWALSEDDSRATTTAHVLGDEAGPSHLVLPVSAGAVEGLGAAPLDVDGGSPRPVPPPPAPRPAPHPPLPATGADQPLAVGAALLLGAAALRQRRRRTGG